MWSILIEGAIWAAFYCINRWIIPDPPKTGPRIDNLELPRTDEGTPIPMVFGRMVVNSSVVAWCSNSEARTDYFPDSAAYFINLFFIVGLPMGYDLTNTEPPTLWSWRIDQKFASWATEYTGTVGIAKPLRGGQHAVIYPVYGQISFYDGRVMYANQAKSVFDPGTGAIVPQVLNDNDKTHANFTLIADAFGHGNGVDDPGDLTLWPSYRNYLTVAMTGIKTSLDGTYVNPLGGAAQTSLGLGQNEGLWGLSLGVTAQMPAIGFEVSSFGDGTISAPGAFGDDADPMQVLWDVLTNPFGKLGIPTSKVDVASLRAASVVLLAEKHGYARVVYDRSDASSLIQSIMQQVDGSLYIDPVTGLFTVKLVRNDYNVLLIPAFTDAANNIVEVTDYGLGAWRDTFNRVEVKYTQRIIPHLDQNPTHLNTDYVTSTAVASNQANAVAQDGVTRLSTIEMPGVTDPVLAASIAARELNVVAQPLAKLTIVVNRDAVSMRPGDPFLVTYAEYGINTVFRVTKIDFGQLFDTKVTINAIQDVWDNVYSGWQIVGTFSFVIPYPMRDRFITESPYWLQYFASTQGTVPSADAQRLLGLGIPGANATQFRWRSRWVVPPFGSTFADDVLVQVPTYGTLAADYARELEPYDNTTGMQVTAGTGLFWSLNSFVPLTASPAQIALGSCLVCVVRADGQHEFMAFESNTSLGAGVYRLNNVWRGLLDTPAIAHSAGERMYFVDKKYSIGFAAWTTVGIQLEVTPVSSGGSASTVGSGDDPVVGMTIQVRSGMPSPAGDMVLNFGTAPFAAGTQGVPASAGDLKSVSNFDEAALPSGSDRERTYPVVQKSSSNQSPAGLTYSVVARKVAGDNLPNLATPFTGYTAVDSLASTAVSNTQHAFALLGPQGHGTIDVAIQASQSTAFRGTINPFNPPPVVRCVAQRWRNLLGNVRFGDVDHNGTLGMDPWVQTGAPSTLQGVAGLTRGATSTYLTGNVGNPSAVSKQTIDVSGYRPRAMNAVVRFYYKTFFGKTTDTVLVSISALDASLAVLSTNSVGPVTGSTTAWTLSGQVLNNLPANTKYLQVVVTQTAVTGTQPGVAVTEFSLRLGDFVENVLANGLFSAGTFTSWTNQVNSFVANATIPLSGTQCAQGGAFASSEIRQTYAVPTGREFGTALLRFYRATTIAGDTGNVIVEALNVSSVVLATAQTGAETQATLSVWGARQLTLDLPAGTTQVRVRLVANRAAGAGNSGACFADMLLSVHKYLDYTTSHSLDFSHVTTQQIPIDWQQSYLAFTSLTVAQSAYVVWGGDSVNPGNQMVWSDGVSRDNQSALGWWSSTVVATNGYRFDGTTYLVGIGSARDKLLNPTPTQGFTVAILFRYDGPDGGVIPGAFGIMGRQDGASGWSCGINGAGHFYAQVRGSLGVATSTCADDVIDNAWHLLVVEINTATGFVQASTEFAAAATASTAAIGDFTNASLSTPLRIGAGSTFDTPAVCMIARVWGFPDGVTGAQVVSAIWSYLGNPTGDATANYSSAAPSWVQLPPNAIGGGERWCCVSRYQWAQTYLAALDNGGGNTGIGLASQYDIGGNLWPSFDFTSAGWVADAAASITSYVVEDHTARRLGATFSVTATDGLSITNAFAATTGRLVFWARAETGSTTCVVELMNTSNVVKSTTSVVLSSVWKRYDVAFSGWDHSTATFKIRFRSNGASTYSMGSVFHLHGDSAIPPPCIIAQPGANYPVALPHIGGAVLPVQFNAEGELIATGATAAGATSPSTAVPAAIILAWDGATNDNQRELVIDSGGVAKFAHYNATAVNAVSTATAVDCSQVFVIRGRWASTKTLDATANAYAGINVTGSVNSTNYGRVATFTYDAVTSTFGVFFGNYLGAVKSNLVLRSVVVRTREEKLA